MNSSSGDRTEWYVRRSGDIVACLAPPLDAKICTRRLNQERANRPVTNSGSGTRTTDAVVIVDVSLRTWN